MKPEIVGPGYSLYIWETERLYFFTINGKTVAVMAISEDDAYSQWEEFCGGPPRLKGPALWFDVLEMAYRQAMLG